MNSTSITGHFSFAKAQFGPELPAPHHFKVRLHNSDVRLALPRCHTGTHHQSVYGVDYIISNSIDCC